VVGLNCAATAVRRGALRPVLFLSALPLWGGGVTVLSRVTYFRRSVLVLWFLGGDLGLAVVFGTGSGVARGADMWLTNNELRAALSER